MKLWTRTTYGAPTYCAQCGLAFKPRADGMALCLEHAKPALELKARQERLTAWTLRHLDEVEALETAEGERMREEWSKRHLNAQNPAFAQQANLNNALGGGLGEVWPFTCWPSST